MARRALRLNGVDFELVADPIAAIIFCPAIRKRLTVELAENGRGFCDTLHNLSQRRSQSEILFNVKEASTNVQPGMRGALDE